jgi:hypothetical protein
MEMPYEDSNQNAKNYQWPADKLTATEMAILYRLREATGKPINHLLRDAILKLSDSANQGPFSTTGEQHAETP